MTRPRGKSPPSPPRRRADTVRLQLDVAHRVSDGHPWIFSDALKGRTLNPELRGSAVDVMDPEGRFIARALADPENNPVLRVFSGRRGEVLDQQYLVERVRDCLQRRREQVGQHSDGCYRLLNGDSEGVPAVTVDRYADFLVVCFFSAMAETYQQPLVDALVQTLQPTGIYLQKRYTPPSSKDGSARPGATLIHGTVAPPEVPVLEGRCRYVVDVSAPSSPGLFLDMRRGREVVSGLAGGRRVLNCFSYTGAFSVVAAVHGAQSVTSVDSASRAHGRGRRNFECNGLDLADPAYEFVTGDAFAVMARLEERKSLFDLVILDPPTFSRAKGRTFNAPKDYSELVAASSRVLDKGGIIVACCNAAKLAVEELDRAIGRGAGLAKRRLVITERLGLPPDFPVLPAFSEGRYLKILVARVI